MSGYIDFPLDDDPERLAEEAIETLMEEIPGWSPNEGNLEVWLIEVWARMVAEARIVASRVPLEIFRFFGQSLVGVQTAEAARATALTTWTAQDNAGYTIPAGTVVAYRIAGDRLIPFETVVETVIDPGDTVAEDVVIQAVEPGGLANALDPGDIELVDSLAFVDSLTADAPTSGGVDAENLDAYLDRLRDELRLLTPRPILPQDFAVLARRVPGVHRALGINLYDPDTETWDNERTVTVAVVDSDGLALSSEVKQEVEDLLNSEREINFVVHVIDPTYTPVSVDVSFTVADGEDPAETEERVADALAEYLNPGVWAGGDATPPVWRPETGVVRYLEIASVVNNVLGVDYITELELNEDDEDIVIDGVAPLPQVGTINVEATE